MIKIKNEKLKIKNYTATIFMFIFIVTYFSFSHAAEWAGVDETVVEKYAEEHGRAAREPFINTDQGDLLLFVFLLAGAIGGFTAGYYWRKILEQKPKNTNASIH